MAKTLRVGMVGYRFMGKAHSNAWRQAPRFFPLKAHVELHTICGRDPAAVQAARSQLGWQNSSTDWHEIIDDPLIDIVDICTANDSHCEIAVAAAQNGKHVLCEKPLALTVKQAQTMFNAAEKSKIVHMVCHNYRRIPAIALAKKMISEGAIGQIYHYHARYAQDRLVDPDSPLTWRLDKRISGSGALGDILSHIIDLARYLVGEFKQVNGMMHTFIAERPAEALGKNAALIPKAQRKMGKVTVDDASIFLGQFENGALANLEATRFALGRKNGIRIEINGSKGSLAFDFEDMNRLKFYDSMNPPDRQGFRDIIVTQANGTHPYAGQWWPPGHILGYEHTFVNTVADFVNACIDRKPIQPTFEDGLKNQRVMEAVEESAKAGKWVKV
jgi:predicted dehydrogenase